MKKCTYTEIERTLHTQFKVIYQFYYKAIKILDTHIGLDNYTAAKAPENFTWLILHNTFFSMA